MTYKNNRFIYYYQSGYSSVSKRPSFTWIQYQSPRKGFLTILIVVGSFFLQWLPTLVGAIYEVIGWDQRIQEWVKSVSFW